MDHLFDISTIKVNLPRDLKNPEEKQKVKLTFQKVFIISKKKKIDNQIIW